MKSCFKEPFGFYTGLSLVRQIVLFFHGTHKVAYLDKKISAPFVTSESPRHFLLLLLPPIFPFRLIIISNGMSGCSKNARILSSIFEKRFHKFFGRRLLALFFWFRRIHLIFFQIWIDRWNDSLCSTFCRIPLCYCLLMQRFCVRNPWHLLVPIFGPVLSKIPCKSRKRWAWHKRVDNL